MTPVSRHFMLPVAVGLLTASCSSAGGGGEGNTAGSLVSTCDTICENVVAQCAPAMGLYGTCLSACNDLNLVQAGCLDPFASYLACIAGATSVQCGANGDYVLITPPQCEVDRQATLTCNLAPGLIAACIALPPNASCAAPLSPARGSGTFFCVGAPNGCAAPSPNPLGIGIYCCP